MDFERGSRTFAPPLFPTQWAAGLFHIRINLYSASRWCRYILRFFDQSNTLAASPLYKAKGAFFLHELLIACTERSRSVHC